MEQREVCLLVPSSAADKKGVSYHAETCLHYLYFIYFIFYLYEMATLAWIFFSFYSMIHIKFPLCGIVGLVVMGWLWKSVLDHQMDVIVKIKLTGKESAKIMRCFPLPHWQTLCHIWLTFLLFWCCWCLIRELLKKFRVDGTTSLAQKVYFCD